LRIPVLTFRTRAAVCIALLLGMPSTGAAQAHVFRDALIAFHSKLTGDDGNEGPAIVANLDRMASALASWNESYSAALRDADAAIAANRNRGSLHVVRGLVLEAMARQQDAVAAFGRAWDLDREDPVSAYLLASRRTSPDDADEIAPQVALLLKVLDRRLASMPAGQHVELLTEIALLPDNAAVTPVFAPALYVDGFTLIEQRRYQEAIAGFRSAIARDPLVISGPGEAHRIQAAKYADAGNGEKAIEELEAAVRLAPDDERASIALGRMLAYAGKTDRAERVLLDVVAKLPKSADAHSALADLYDSAGRGRDALKHVEAAAALTVPAGKAALYLRLADLYHRYLEYERVIDPLVKRLRLVPNDAQAHRDLGLAYTRIGRTSDALAELVFASILGPEDGEALAAIGQIHFDAGNYAAAETVLRRAIAATPTLAQPHYVLGQTLARLARESQSQAELAEFDRLRGMANDETRRLFEKEQRQR
jgi:tetratricopeptide (TPR) repeat protein